VGSELKQYACPDPLIKYFAASTSEQGCFAVLECTIDASFYESASWIMNVDCRDRVKSAGRAPQSVRRQSKHRVTESWREKRAMREPVEKTRNVVWRRTDEKEIAVVSLTAWSTPSDTHMGEVLSHVQLTQRPTEYLDSGVSAQVRRAEQHASGNARGD
jgi:hypothetical protein